MCGFESDSTNTAFVSGRIAARTASTSVTSTRDTSMPFRAHTSSRKKRVMMKTSSEAMQWSPCFNRLKIVFATAAIPEAHATAVSAPSSAATFSSSASVVGFCVRV